MRRQYHARSVGNDTHIWDVQRLAERARGLPVQRIPLSEIAELDEDWWFSKGNDSPTPRALAKHMKLVNAADLAYPIILCAEGRLMDGMHRVVKALVENTPGVDAVQFLKTPDPDFLNVSLDDLPYD